MTAENEDKQTYDPFLYIITLAIAALFLIFAFGTQNIAHATLSLIIVIFVLYDHYNHKQNRMIEIGEKILAQLEQNS